MFQNTKQVLKQLILTPALSETSLASGGRAAAQQVNLWIEVYPGGREVESARLFCACAVRVTSLAAPRLPARRHLVLGLHCSCWARRSSIIASEEGGGVTSGQPRNPAIPQP